MSQSIASRYKPVATRCETQRDATRDLQMNKPTLAVCDRSATSLHTFPKEAGNEEQGVKA
eukprot:3099667-Amphidinium_carterae.1